MPDPTPRLHLLAHDADRLLRCLLAPDGGAALQVFRLGDVGAEVCLTATDVDAFLRVLRPARLIQVLVERQQVHLLEQALAAAEEHSLGDNPFFDLDGMPAAGPEAPPVWHFTSAPGRRACGDDTPNAWSTDRPGYVTCPRCLNAMPVSACCPHPPGHHAFWTGPPGKRLCLARGCCCTDLVLDYGEEPPGDAGGQDCLTTGTCQGTCTGPLECVPAHETPAVAEAVSCHAGEDGGPCPGCLHAAYVAEQQQLQPTGTAPCEYCALPRDAHVLKHSPSGYAVWWCPQRADGRWPCLQYAPVSPREEKTHE